MVSFPPCKINLGLYVISKRPDGYHNIETCFYPVPWHDMVEIIPARKFSFSMSGISIPGALTNNLCIKAYEILREDYKLSAVSMHLHKIIPVGAGLGGGSSDAAFTLRVLNKIFDLAIGPDRLRGYAASLGSDCSFFLGDTPMIGSGKGEELTGLSLSLKGKYMVIVKPDFHLSTAEAYAHITPRAPQTELRKTLEKPIREWKHFLTNDFEDSIFQRYPLIKALQLKLYAHDAAYASMSGSGSSVFGIFEKAVDLKKDFEGFTSWSGYLH